MLQGLRQYAADRARDVADFAHNTRRHPGSLPQNLLGLFAVLITCSGERLAAEGPYVSYGEARGAASWVVRHLFRQGAINLGCFTISAGPMPPGSRRYRHEATHYRQQLGDPLWLGRYLVEAIRVGFSHDRNRFEREAILAALDDTPPSA
jgi:hypothetical protein